MTQPAYKAWYKTYRWQQLRKRHLHDNPLCVMCEREGKYKLANICDHIEPHRGDETKFWEGPFQSLCKAHHDSTKQAMEKSGVLKVAVGRDGWPISDTPRGMAKV
ncbi:hypothetical protein [Bordetella genomosp. 9]|uniref:hypothetical protein n=1 Tax=Bordetella genomosp. 9 TaxID=1416803 RepID=UPI0018DFE533|nr:hypothetical protein [Bordetella genomosp. 9]